MRTFIFLLVAIAVAAVIAYELRSVRGIKGDGVIQTEKRDVTEFTKLQVEGGYEIQWSNGDLALTITTDENLLPLIRTQISEGTLHIDSAENLRPSHQTKITLSSKALAGVELTGGNSLKAVALSGSELKLRSTGASTINVDGSVNRLEANLTGASTLHARTLETKITDLNLTGACNADVSASDTLKASITGAGSVSYSGNPKTVDQHIAGAGSIRPRQ